MASGSGLDPDLTLPKAEFQLERVAAKWADDTKRNAADIRKDIDESLPANGSAAFGGLAGEKFVNVPEVNLELCKHYGLSR
jgi:potassium-transporting ATPase KdpC subunit